MNIFGGKAIHVSVALKSLQIECILMNVDVIIKCLYPYRVDGAIVAEFSKFMQSIFF